MIFSKLLKIQVLALFCVQQAWVFHLFGFIWPVVVVKLRQLNWSFWFQVSKSKMPVKQILSGIRDTTLFITS